MMNNIELANKLKEIATKYKTLYVYGCFGAPMTAANKTRYKQHTDYNKQPARQKMIDAASSDTFGFDCVCLIKGVLWGWTGDKTKTYGGAKYNVNGVPDISANQMITKCKNLSTDFSKIEIGEAVWCEGHIGIYIGDGLAVECTPKWKNCVQITACNCDKKGYNRRNWVKHGKLPYIEYIKEEKKEEKPVVTTKPATTTKPKTTYGNAGDAIKLASTPLYATSVSSAIAGRKSGTYYIYNNEVINGRVRITNSKINVGKAGQVTGWVSVSQISLIKPTATTTKPATKPAATTTTAFKVGDKIKISNKDAKYTNNVRIPAWVRLSTLYVRKVEQNGKVLLVSTSMTSKSYTGRLYASDCKKK